MGERDPNRKIQWRQALIAPGGRLMQLLSGLERILTDVEAESGGGGEGTFTSGAVTVADLAAWRAVGWISCGTLDGIPTDYISTCFPRLAALHAKVHAMPEVQQWMAEHPTNYRRM